MSGPVLHDAEGRSYRLLGPFQRHDHALTGARFALAEPLERPGERVLIKDYLAGIPEDRAERRAFARQRAARAHLVGTGIRHPALLRVHGLIDGRHLVMDRLRGLDLGQAFHSQRPTRPQLLAILRPIAAALASLPSQFLRLRPQQPDVGHSDLKAENIVLCRSGPVLVDLDDVGIVLEPEEPLGPRRRSWVLEHGAALNKSPEHVLGRIPYADHQGDLFALGLLVHRLIYLEHAFASAIDYLDLLDQLAGLVPRRGPLLPGRILARCRQGDPLARVLARMTDFDREARYPGIAAALVEIERVLAQSSH